MIQCLEDIKQTSSGSIDQKRILHGRTEIRNFSSSVEKYFTSERSERVKYFFKHERRNFISPSDHVMFYLLYKHQRNAKPFNLNNFWSERCRLLWSHSNGDIFTCEDNMLFSHVKSSPLPGPCSSLLSLAADSKSLNFTKICMFGGTNLPRPHHTNICKFSQLWGALSLLV